MRVALAQINTTVGDIDGNATRIVKAIEEAHDQGAELILLPELVLFGYPPKDLLRRSELVDRNLRALESIASRTQSATVVVGYVQPDDSGAGNGVHNAAAVCREGSVVGSYAKTLLPTYDVFDEARYFSPGGEACVVDVPSKTDNRRVGLTICEDLWNDAQFHRRRVYGVNPVERAVSAGADLLVNIGASPFVAGKQQVRQSIFAEQVREFQLPLVCVNAIGGQDDLIFDGGSFALNADGQVIAQAAAFCEDLVVFDLETPDRAITPYPGEIESIRRALVLGVRDYMAKCGFTDAVIGLSGGIDSAVTAAVAVESIGAEHVHGVAMPSRFSSDHSVEDARRLADNLGIDCSLMPIEPVHRAMETAVEPHFSKAPRPTAGVANENIQARIRGNLLMSLSNRFGWLLLTTGNKSELAVGYCTLYGDMCGGLAVLSDVPKTIVYRLAQHVNESVSPPVIPQRTIDKPPSAELRDDQTDQDSLPPYDLLDTVLQAYVEEDRSVEQMVASGLDESIVRHVVEMVDRNEYKRQQAPVGLKVTSRAFGTGRRMPIAAKHR